MTIKSTKTNKGPFSNSSKFEVDFIDACFEMFKYGIKTFDISFNKGINMSEKRIKTHFNKYLKVLEKTYLFERNDITVVEKFFWAGLKTADRNLLFNNRQRYSELKKFMEWVIASKIKL